MEEIEKTLKSHTWTEDASIKILLNSNSKNVLKEMLPMFRRYTDAIVIHYQTDLVPTAMICIGNNTISLA